LIVGSVLLVAITQRRGLSPRPGALGSAALLLDEVTVLAADIVRSGQFFLPPAFPAIPAAVGLAVNGTSPAARATPSGRPLPFPAATTPPPASACIAFDSGPGVCGDGYRGSAMEFAGRVIAAR
jgi:hypothetical protein